MPDKPNYYHFNNKSSSQIDLFIERTSETLVEFVTIREHEATNTGPHDPVTASFTVTEPRNPKQSDQNAEEKPKPRVKWEKG